MDHRELLKKYIKYVGDVEGTEFINPHDMRNCSDVKFTDQEWTELELCVEEIRGRIIKTAAVAE